MRSILISLCVLMSLIWLNTHLKSKKTAQMTAKIIVASAPAKNEFSPPIFLLNPVAPALTVKNSLADKIELESKQEASRTLTPPDVRPGSPQVEGAISVITELRFEWERRRDQIYDQMNLPADTLESLRRGRNRYDWLTDSYLGELRSSQITDQRFADSIVNIQQVETEFDSFVRDLIGTERFLILQDALENFNSQIEMHSPVKHRFESLW